MEFVTEKDLELITSLAGKDVDEDSFEELKQIYAKLKHICVLLESKGFTYDIRQDPRRQAGTGRFVFQEYQWAKVYPKEYYAAANNKFAYIIGFSDTVHFHLMGIKDNQEKPASLQASKECWTEIEIENSSYDDVVSEFIKFDKNYRKLFIETGAALGITEFIILKKKWYNNKSLNY